MSAGIFRQDNPYNTVMGRIGDLAMLSVSWFVCSIPIVTIGPSTSAACERSWSGTRRSRSTL